MAGEPWPAIFFVTPAHPPPPEGFRMGYWGCLQAFDCERWEPMFCSGTGLVEQKIRDALLGWEEGYYDGTDKLGPGWAREKILASHKGREAIVLATHLARNGFTYDGLDATQCARLDDLG